MRLNFLVLSLLMLVLGACTPINDPANPKNVGDATTAPMVDYGNGVCYIETEGSDFGNTLSELSARHPGQTITWGVGKTNDKGKIIGYFIHITGGTKCSADTAFVD